MCRKGTRQTWSGKRSSPAGRIIQVPRGKFTGSGLFRAGRRPGFRASVASPGRLAGRGDARRERSELLIHPEPQAVFPTLSACSRHTCPGIPVPESSDSSQCLHPHPCPSHPSTYHTDSIQATCMLISVAWPRPNLSTVHRAWHHPSGPIYPLPSSVPPKTHDRPSLHRCRWWGCLWRNPVLAGMLKAQCTMAFCGDAPTQLGVV